MKKLSLFIFLSFFIFLSCNNSADENISDSDNNTTVSVEDMVLKTVADLPEYNDAEINVKAMTNGEQSLSSIIEAPNADHSEYLIQVGYNQESWFETYYFFYVNPETFEVFIDDVIEGDIVPIETWRIRENNR